MYRLNATCRCELFELIAEDVWKHIAHNHAQGVSTAEIGITKDIIAVIVRHYKLNRNFGVWADRARFEHDLGADIDVFVETETNQFLWYALQAKVLDVDGHYDDLKRKSQWEQLREIGNAADCYYLFYNGFDRVPGSITDCCNAALSEMQMGCAIIYIDDVERISTCVYRPSYTAFYKGMHPWRELVCCKARRKGGREIFSLHQVQDVVARYENILNNNLLVPGTGKEMLNSGVSITSANAKADRTVETIYVVRTTAGLNQ